MSDRVIDCRGMVCPQPVINTKRAIEAADAGRITVIVDNQVAKTNVAKFAAASGLGAAIEEQGGHYYITMMKGAEQQPVAPAAPVVADDNFGSQVYLITQNTMGHGSPELGQVLIKAFITTLLEIKPRPAALLLINSGVKLAVQGSPVIEPLQILAERGVTVLSCGTCLDYYQLQSQLAVGDITNMYTIVETISHKKTVTI